MALGAKIKADRRSKITHALYQCIARQGYANVKFNDVAAVANMSPSHLGYYFQNKAAVLEYYVSRICRKNLDELPPLTEADMAKQIELLVNFCFGSSMMNENLMGVMKELNGLAVHDPALNKIKTNHTAEWKAYLGQFFENARVVNSGEAATKAHAMLTGLNTDVLFDEALSVEEAGAIFGNYLFELCGLSAGPKHTLKLHSE